MHNANEEVDVLNRVVERIRATADYQFGKGVGSALFPESVTVEFSRNTGRIRYIFLKNDRLATLRPTDGLFSLSVAGARRLLENTDRAKCSVMVKDTVSGVIAEGGDVFAVHVMKADKEIRAGDEIVVIDQSGGLLAVGHSVLSGEEMEAFEKGVAVKVRHGNMEER